MIKGFFGEYRFLSNFWYSPVIVYPSVWDIGLEDVNQVVGVTNEHVFQSLKTEDTQAANFILPLKSPHEAKKQGYAVTLRPNWNNIRIGVMYQINKAKYLQNRYLRNKLINTGDAYLEETNTWNDTFWGISNGIGQNHLGKILMQIREEMKWQNLWFQ